MDFYTILVLLTLLGQELVAEEEKMSGTSIPICCDLKTSNMKCDEKKMSRLSQTTHVVPEPMPPEIAHRLRFNELVNQTHWIQRDLKCKTPVNIRNFSIDEREFEFQRDGYLILWNEMGSADYLHVTQYCLNGIQENRIFVKFCHPACTPEEPCIQRCCPLDEVFALRANATTRIPCINQGNSNWRPKLYKKLTDSKTLASDKDWLQIQPRHFLRSPSSWAFRNCKNNLVREFIDNKELHSTLGDDVKNGRILFAHYKLDRNGKLHLRDGHRKWVEEAEGRYCIAGVTGATDEGNEKNINASYAVICVLDEAFDIQENQQSDYYGIITFCCSFFALATVIAYFLLFDKQNIHGWTTISHSTSVFFLFIFVGIAHITKDDKLVHSNVVGCLIVATLAHYFFLATFTWLLILSIEFCLTFRTFSAPRGRGSRGVRRFLIYSLIGWSLPGLIVTIAWILEVKYKDDPDSEVMVPMYGEMFCYISRFAIWEFLYAPSAILFILNVSCFIYTTITLRKFQKSTAIATKNSNQQDRQSYTLFLKLFLICGLIWSIELLSFMFIGAHTTWYVQILDSLNIFQPIAIFFIFVFKVSVIRPIYERYVYLRPIVYPAKVLLCYYSKTPWHTTKTETEVTALATKPTKKKIPTHGEA